MSYIEEIVERAKQVKKRIVLPESMDERVLEAASIIKSNGISDIILIGNREEIVNKYPSLESVEIINPSTSNLTNKYIEMLVELRKNKNLSVDEARKLLLEDYMYFACMLVLDNQADGIVSGACHSTANTLRPALQLIKSSPGTKLVSSFFIMVINNSSYGDNGTFIFSDCGIIQEPSSEELAQIAISSIKSWEELVGTTPYVAMLSHSTKGSATHPAVDKVVEATKILKTNYPQYKIDGELQADAALVPTVATMKAPDSEVAGHANILIFPNLDSGNIAYKLVERLADAKAYGPLTQGMRRPVNDLSRGCSVADIVGVVALTAIQAQNPNQN